MSEWILARLLEAQAQNLSVLRTATAGLFGDAAAEIRRLRELLGTLHGVAEERDLALESLASARKENQRLREALKRIEVLDYTLDAPIGDEARLTLACMIAREALKEAEDE